MVLHVFLIVKEYPFSFSPVGAFHLYSDEKDVENKTGIGTE